ncbi:MAG: glyoxalase [Thermoplasmata archaeon]|nr:glyoxalase [Thermoplasmata archaeon]MCI4341455.1 glyoxalase [Thermoplasmata archaeon]
MPEGGEPAARRFYGQLLALEEIPKPPRLAARGGVWFRLGPQELHLAVESNFTPARRAHPAFHWSGLAALREELREAGVLVREEEPLPGFRRFYVDDPFGNRLEFLEPES